MSKDVKVKSARTIGMRASPEEAEWFKAWKAESGQSDSLVLNAGFRVLCFILEGMDFEEKVRFISTLRYDLKNQPQEEIAKWRQRVNSLAALSLLSEEDQARLARADLEEADRRVSGELQNKRVRKGAG